MPKGYGGKQCATLSDKQKAEIREQIAAGDSTPFRELTSLLIENQPTPASIRKYANAYPDRWMQALTQAAKLTGNFDKDSPKVEMNFYQQINNMSDAQAIVWLENYFRSLGIEPPPADKLLAGRVIDAEPG